MKNHSATLKFLVLKWELCDLFCDYLYYTEHFDVYRDYNPFT